MKEKTVIGRIDKVDLPEFNIKDMPTKIDTGAYTSSIHCTKIKQVEDTLYFQIPRSDKKDVGNFSTTHFYEKKIRSSNGKSERRFIIKTSIVLFNKSYKTEFSLSNRSSMKNPILLGRKLLKNRFIVDISQANLSYKAKSKWN